MSRASRRHARQQQRRKQVGQTRQWAPDRPVPQLTVAIIYPPGSTPLAEEGATVTLPFVPEQDDHGRARFNLRLKTNNKDLSAEEAAALLGASLDYLRLTWSQYGEALDIIADLERNSVTRVATSETTTINARGGAA